ncbi:Endonuclease/exonuclease/phosphatase superfamily [Sesbania bispinosa]|nr:Endonuclease/exonuclease/phosphatase superfamily [Sesbania bispinosa]
MKIISWNCRGVAATATVSELRELSSKHRPTIVFLMETRAKEGKLNRLKRLTKLQHLFCVEPDGLSGGLALFWDNSVEVEIISSTTNIIHAAITDKDSAHYWETSFVYGNPIPSHRRSLWNDLAHYHFHRKMPSTLLGDFNEMLHPHEKDGLRPCNSGMMQLFRDFVNHMGLMDLELKGNRFTRFSNPRRGIVIKENLDRVLVNWAWRDIFPHAIATALPAISSDHSPIVLDFDPQESSGTQFKYELMWDEHVECKEVV